MHYEDERGFVLHRCVLQFVEEDIWRSFSIAYQKINSRQLCKLKTVTSETV